MHKIGFIGAGNMGGALIVAAAKSVAPQEVIIADHSFEKAKALAGQIGCHAAASNEEIVADAEYVVLAVKPNVIRDVVRSIAPAVTERARSGGKLILVTIAAGITVAAIKECLETDVPVIRMMPNTPALVGRGMILLTSGAENPGEITEKLFAELQSRLAAAGDFERIPETAMDYTTSVSGCTPAYAFMFIDALADGAVQVGVPRAQALRLAAKTVLGSAAMVLETGEHPDALKDKVCSPGGSTIVGVTALEQYGFRYAVAQSIIQSTEKNLSLGK